MKCEQCRAGAKAGPVVCESWPRVERPGHEQHRTIASRNCSGTTGLGTDTPTTNRSHKVTYLDDVLLAKALGSEHHLDLLVQQHCRHNNNRSDQGRPPRWTHDTCTNLCKRASVLACKHRSDTQAHCDAPASGNIPQHNRDTEKQSCGSRSIPKTSRQCAPCHRAQ